MLTKGKNCISAQNQPYAYMDITVNRDITTYRISPNKRPALIVFVGQIYRQFFEKIPENNI